MSNYWSHTLSHRLSRRRTIAATGATAAAAAFLAACGGSGTSSSKGDASTEKKGSGLTVPLLDETKSLKRGGIYKSTLTTPPTLDPHFTGSHVTHVWMNYSQLLKVKPGYMTASDLDVEPEIMESWEYSPDKLTITGKITQNAKFPPIAPTNGRALDMKDVLFSWDRFKAVSPRAAEYANDKNPTAPILSVTAPDDRTLVIKLAKPQATFLSTLVGGVPGTLYMVPKEAEKTSVLDLKGAMAGTGPFYLAEYVPSSRSSFRRNAGFKVDKRDVPYVEGVDFVDLNEVAAVLAQFKTGAIHDTFANFLPDDILPTKKDIPELEVQASSIYTPANDRAFFGQDAASAFKDERVRQAWVMCWDRELFFEAALNTKKFRDAGLPVDTGYDNGLRGLIPGWYLNPQDKDFGPNAKYFMHDPAEAKKLLAAAGFDKGVDHDVFYGTLAAHTPSYGQHIQIIQGMTRDTGLFRPVNKELNYNTEWNTTFRNNKGKFTGQAWIYDTGESDPANDLYSHYHSTGSRYFGGDSTMDGMLDKMLQEFDVKKRQSLAHDVLRYEGGKMWQPRPGGATGFRITWPALRNKNVWQGDNQGRYLATLWLDQDKPPFKKA